MVDPSRVRVSGPLESYASGFVVELASEGYRPLPAAYQLRLMAHLSRWLAGEGLEPADLSAAAVGEFLAARRAAGYRTLCSPRALEPSLEYLRGMGVVPAEPAVVACTAVDVLLERYRCYLLSERGLAAVTVRGYADMVRPFLAGRAAAGGLDLEQLRPGDVTAFVLAECPGRASGSAKLLVTALRSFLGFLHVAGVLEESLTVAVPSVAGWRLAGLPRGLERGEARRLLAGCDRRTTVGRRDFAILSLLARLGLRRGEVARLELGDVDWRAGELVIRGKGNRQERLPLPVDVGEAVVGYLRRGRPSSAQGRCVFVRVKAPHRALTPGGVTQVVVSAARRAGLGEVTAHRLRHTAATEMLRAGATLPEIGQVLRHRSLLTTAIYAKVDREALRSLARPWLGGVA
ncbi:MAG: tyrosine-type recombinase/integrase [Solirubrobacterales bacterium]|nr:tyrosine-type recombinase/integrase [Solirubrobacterales bacterium]